MCVMPFAHARGAMSQISAQYDQRHPCHHAQACVGVPQCMKVDRRLDLRPGACLGHWPALVASPPRLPAAIGKDAILTALVDAGLPEKLDAFSGQDDMAGLAALGLPDSDRAAVGMEIGNHQPA